MSIDDKEFVHWCQERFAWHWAQWCARIENELPYEPIPTREEFLAEQLAEKIYGASKGQCSTVQ